MEKIRTYWKKIRDMIKYRFWCFKGWVKEHKRAAILGVVIFIAVIGFVFGFLLRTYHNYEVVDSMERNSDTSANYYFREDGIICYSKDGVSFTNNNGEVVWNQVFGMSSPKMNACGDYIAIGDVGANSVYIFNGSGSQGQITLEKPLQDLRVSKQGVVAVILSDDAANQINLYDKRGNVLVSVKATIDTTGYPLTLALSEDASRMAVSYVMFNDGKISTQLVFYNFSNMENSSEPIGTFTYDQLIPKLEFVNDQTVLACAEDGFRTYRFKETVLEQIQQTFETELKSIFVTDKNIGIVMKNMQEAPEGKTVDKYAVRVYNFSGGKAGSFTFDFDYKSVSASNKEIIFYNDQECEVYSYRGHKKFQYAFEHNIESILPGEKAGEYILLDAQNMQTIRVK